VEGGFACCNPPRMIRIDGQDEADSVLGEIRIAGMEEDSRALYRGKLEVEQGQNRIPGAVVVTGAFSDPDFIENRSGGCLFGLYSRPGLTGFILDGGRFVIDYTGMFMTEEHWRSLLQGAGPSAGRSRESAALIVDTRDVTHVDRSSWVVSMESRGPRQSVALIGARVHFLSRHLRYNLMTGEVSLPGRMGRSDGRKAKLYIK